MYKQNQTEQKGGELHNAEVEEIVSEAEAMRYNWIRK